MAYIIGRSYDVVQENLGPSTGGSQVVDQEFLPVGECRGCCPPKGNFFAVGSVFSPIARAYTGILSLNPPIDKVGIEYPNLGDYISVGDATTFGLNVSPVMMLVAAGLIYYFIKRK
jgi:hypothetical protein